MMPFDRFTERAQDVIARSQEILMRYNHNQMDTEHVFLALLEQPDGLAGEIFEEVLGVNTEMLAMQLDEYLTNNRKLHIPGRSGSGNQIYVTPRIQRIGQVAMSEAQSLSDEYISTEHILLAIASEERGHAARLLSEAGVDKEDIRMAIEEVRGGQKVTDPRAETRYRVLSKYGRDLTELARAGKLDPVVGRGEETLRLTRGMLEKLRGLHGDPEAGLAAYHEAMNARGATYMAHARPKGEARPRIEEPEDPRPPTGDPDDEGYSGVVMNCVAAIISPNVPCAQLRASGRARACATRSAAVTCFLRSASSRKRWYASFN